MIILFLSHLKLIISPGLLYKTIFVKITLILLILYKIDLILKKHDYLLVNFKYNFF